MDAFIDGRYYASALKGDLEGVLACYTPDVTYWGLGRTEPLIGRDAVRTAFQTRGVSSRPVRIESLARRHGSDYVVDEARVEYRVTGNVSGHDVVDRHVVVRILHYLVFRDGLIARDSAWVDQQSVLDQLERSTDTESPPQSS